MYEAPRPLDRQGAGLFAFNGSSGHPSPAWSRGTRPNASCCNGEGRGPAYQPPNQTPMPWMMPIGKKVAEAISSGRLPFDAQHTMEVSQAE